MLELRVTNGFIGDELDATGGQIKIERVAPQFGFPTGCAGVSFVVCSARDAVEVDNDANASSKAASD